jgi:uncharacterized phiE125 gp8 family phage protein
MEWRRTAQPAFEPISIDDLKMHSRITGTTEDTYLGSLITAARMTVEAEAWRVLMGTTCELAYDAWPASSTIRVPMPPLYSVTSIKYTSDAGVEATFSSTNYVVDTSSTPGRIALKDGVSWPTTTLQKIGGIKIVYVAGYTAVLASNADAPTVAAARALVPVNFIHAIKLIAASLYEHREQVIVGAGLMASQIPMGVHDLIAMDRAFEF